MADIKSPEERSRNMSHIRSRDTQPEVWFRKLLFSWGYRYRKNEKKIPGHPDIWMPGRNTAIFVHGCFWHRHQGCKYAYSPKSRTDFWEKKFDNNIRRDQEVQKQLAETGIRNIVIWECTIRKMKASPEVQKMVQENLLGFFSGDSLKLEI